jgi:hypothetical protein
MFITIGLRAFNTRGWSNAKTAEAKAVQLLKFKVACFVLVKEFNSK